MQTVLRFKVIICEIISLSVFSVVHYYGVYALLNIRNYFIFKHYLELCSFLLTFSVQVALHSFSVFSYKICIATSPALLCNYKASEF